MDSDSTPIGFEGMFTKQTNSCIGFEQYETEPNQNPMPAYPLNDTMPNPDQLVLNNHIYFNNSSRQTTHSTLSAKKSLSCPRLLVIYNEITDVWFREKWLIFSDKSRETFLTLDCQINDTVTIQTAIDEYYSITDSKLIHAPPECLLIQAKSKSKSLFIPNSMISLENLYEKHVDEKYFQYKLMAIICHSNETNKKLMFYKDFQSNSWYVYYDQSITSHSHSNILSNDEQYQIESLIQQKNHVDLSILTSPLSALSNHPIIYVYIPVKKQ